MKLPRPAIQPLALLNSLLGMASLVAAGLIVVLLATIGHAAWQRATLTERWLALRGGASAAGSQVEALRDVITGTRRGTENAQSDLASDIEIAQFVATIRTEAGAWGLAVLQLSAQPVAPVLSQQRSFALRVQGAEAQLPGFLAHLAGIAPTGSRIEQVTLAMAAERSEMSLLLLVPTQSSNP